MKDKRESFCEFNNTKKLHNLIIYCIYNSKQKRKQNEKLKHLIAVNLQFFNHMIESYKGTKKEIMRYERWSLIQFTCFRPYQHKAESNIYVIVFPPS